MKKVTVPSFQKELRKGATGQLQLQKPLWVHEKVIDYSQDRYISILPGIFQFYLTDPDYTE